ncbi:hypothetical protein A2165_00310 [Candidatus Curtissbacteria bacterium RBG_13_40_7]|uniref:Regulatory protein YycH-like domain-containing protein n=1 Tax=Candidatus Curtissbacteria bacterium RBG_13_40_7 TaxID=1797706 RepID=A0A1F5FWC4_9BACT|nr:MAG: hypothetical protein A2165_00310 [Candidatus Curtissbacteria bacterium RBG_13_40_7]
MKWTLTEIASFINQRWLFAVLVLLGLVSFGLIIYKFILTPGKSSPIILPFEKLEIKKLPTLSKLPQTMDFSSLKTEEMPKNLPVFNLEKKALSGEDAILIAKKLGISQNPNETRDAELGIIYYFYQRPLSLTVQESQFRFTKAIAPQGNIPTQEQAEIIAQNFLKNMGFGEDLEIDRENIKYFSSDSPKSLPPADTNIDIIQIPFINKIQDIPVLGNDPKENLFYVRVSRDGEVTGLKYTILPDNKKLGEFPTLNSKEAQVAFLKGEAVLSYLLAKDDEGAETASDYKVSSVSLTGAKPAYLFQPKDKTLQPVYVFWGHTKMDQGKSGEIAFYVPGIKRTNQTRF